MARSDLTEPPLTLEQKLALSQQKLTHWQELAANPNLSPRAAAWVRDMAMSAQAIVRLYQKALAYKHECDARPIVRRHPHEQTDDEALMQVLGMPPRSRSRDAG